MQASLTAAPTFIFAVSSSPNIAEKSIIGMLSNGTVLAEVPDEKNFLGPLPVFISL